MSLTLAANSRRNKKTVCHQHLVFSSPKSVQTTTINSFAPAGHRTSTPEPVFLQLHGLLGLLLRRQHQGKPPDVFLHVCSILQYRKLICTFQPLGLFTSSAHSRSYPLCSTEDRVVGELRCRRQLVITTNAICHQQPTLPESSPPCCSLYSPEKHRHRPSSRLCCSSESAQPTTIPYLSAGFPSLLDIHTNNPPVHTPFEMR